MPRDDDSVLLYDKRAVERIMSYTAGGRAEFLSSPMIQDALIRNLEIVGEAGGKLSDAAKDRMPEVPWRRVTGLRNILVHGYRDVDVETAWRVVEDEPSTTPDRNSKGTLTDKVIGFCRPMLRLRKWPRSDQARSPLTRICRTP